MSKTALFVRHKAKPGQRDKIRGVWEKFVKPRVKTNPAHEAYYFCFDDSDPDVVCVFQLLSSKDSLSDFMSGAWYPEYLKEVTQYVAEDPQINPASPVWVK